MSNQILPDDKWLKVTIHLVVSNFGVANKWKAEGTQRILYIHNEQHFRNVMQIGCLTSARERAIPTFYAQDLGTKRGHLKYSSIVNVLKNLATIDKETLEKAG